jgi:mRNA interferase MazF
MSVSRGDVVILNAPFVTRPGGKARPMLVIQDDRNNARMANTILATITTNTSRSREPTQVLIDIVTTEGQQSGLLATSVVTCENLLTVAQRQIVRKIGTLPPSLMQQVDAALKASLCLP